MLDNTCWEWILRIGLSAPLGHGLGHMGHLRGAGIMFGAKLLILGVAVTGVFVLAAMAAPVISDWIGKRYNLPDYTGAAGWGAFLIIAFVLVLALVFGLARIL